ncbi:MAG: hypothetical protein ACTSWY_09500, partial [Promethearchaeota archaeon]
MVENSKILNFKEIRLLYVVARRVANKPIKSTLLNGKPKTDGTHIWLPLSGKEFRFEELIGLAAHEGSHIRFKSLFKGDFHKEICKENPYLGRVIINLFEDARVDYLLKKTYPGFWKELHLLNLRMAKKTLKVLVKEQEDVLSTNRAANFIITITGLHLIGENQVLFNDKLRIKDGSFKFASPELSEFWA